MEYIIFVLNPVNYVVVKKHLSERGVSDTRAASLLKIFVNENEARELQKWLKR